MSTGIRGLEREVGDLLLTRLHVVRDLAPLFHTAAATFVQRVLGRQQLGTVREEPGHTVRGPAFFVRRERDDDVAVGHDALGLHAEEDREMDRALILVVGDAAAIEGAVLLDELERGERPVLRIRLDHVDV